MTVSSGEGGNRGSEDLTPPAEGFELYRHRKTDATGARGWHGYYWARRITGGDYEIRSVPTSLGEPSAPGGVFPKEGFERLYERVESPGSSPPETTRRPGTEIV